MKHIVAGISIVNDIIFADGSSTKNHIGGAIFGVGGILAWESDVLYVTKAGRDFKDYYGKFFDANHLSYDGIYYDLPHTHYNELKYNPDGSGRYIEYSIIEEGYMETYAPQTRLWAHHVADKCTSETISIYLDEHIEGDCLQEVAKIRAAAPNAKINWEIPTDNTSNPAVRDKVLKAVSDVDIFSLNLPESYDLFGTKSEGESIEHIKSMKTPCFFRVGSKGAYMIIDGKAYFAPSHKSESSVDPTGCGNCSTATAGYLFSIGEDPLMSVVKCNISAGLNAAQYGPYPYVSNTQRAEFLKLAKELYDLAK